MPLPRRWIELTFRAPEPVQEILIASLTPLGFTGFLQDDVLLTATLPSSLWNSPTRTRIYQLTGDLAIKFSGQNFSFSVRTVARQNWTKRWERSAGIVEATERIVIKPGWRKLRKRDRGKIVIHIDPKMSFGTGHHETTRLCLVLLEEHIRKGARVLDMGSGTAVLSIAAAKLGARSVLAIDSDEWALANARENVSRNRVRGVRILRALPARNAGRFGLILSNIDLSTNLRHLRKFARILEPDGTLILSGLLSKDLPVFLDALNGTGLVPIECVEENEWVALALGKPHAN
jgi:ribosomal protein L11 methyltransferase